MRIVAACLLGAEPLADARNGTRYRTWGWLTSMLGRAVTVHDRGLGSAARGCCGRALRDRAPLVGGEHVAVGRQRLDREHLVLRGHGPADEKVAAHRCGCERRPRAVEDSDGDDVVRREAGEATG